jgi:hypothetical protein
MLGLDVPEFGRKPFRGLPGEDRMSGLYRGGDTRVLIVDPGHLMVTSYGPDPVLVPPPTPDSLVNKAALAGLVFSTEPKKFRTYTLQFKSAIGAQYKVTLERAIETSDFGPT